MKSWWKSLLANTEIKFLEDFDEELLALHDAEIQRLKQHYEDHKELFEGVHRWEGSWRLFLELEVSAIDVERKLHENFSYPTVQLKQII